tara:strand:+ start:404 stop:550 length:147 start_codon:yes stop_codon:yes gene_type:complete
MKAIRMETIGQSVAIVLMLGTIKALAMSAGFKPHLVSGSATPGVGINT